MSWYKSLCQQADLNRNVSLRPPRAIKAKPFEHRSISCPYPVRSSELNALKNDGMKWQPNETIIWTFCYIVYPYWNCRVFWPVRWWLTLLNNPNEEIPEQTLEPNSALFTVQRQCLQVLCFLWFHLFECFLNFCGIDRCNCCKCRQYLWRREWSLLYIFIVRPSRLSSR